MGAAFKRIKTVGWGLDYFWILHLFTQNTGGGRLFSNNLQESDFSISQAFRKEMNFKFYCDGIGFLLPLPFVFELSFQQNAEMLFSSNLFESNCI